MSVTDLPSTTVATAADSRLCFDLGRASSQQLGKSSYSCEGSMSATSCFAEEFHWQETWTAVGCWSSLASCMDEGKEHPCLRGGLRSPSQREVCSRRYACQPVRMSIAAAQHIYSSILRASGAISIHSEYLADLPCSRAISCAASMAGMPGNTVMSLRPRHRHRRSSPQDKADKTLIQQIKVDQH